MSLRWFFNMPPSQPPPWTGEKPRLPPRSRGGLGWGLCLNLTAKTLTNRVSKVHYLLREGNRAARPIGSPCGQGEP